MRKLTTALAGLVAMAVLPAAASAQTADELIYSVNRTPEATFDVGRATEVITIDEIWRKNARNLPELLMQEAGIYVQQTNYGGGSPYIRGMIGKHILIMVDGVKINNATYRFGPIQYLSTIDLNTVERVEIVRGVGSVLASAMMGGVINVITKKGPPAGEDMRVGGSALSRFSSADRALTGNVQAYGRSDTYRFFGGFTYRNSNDLDGGSNIGSQAGTGYDELAGNVNMDFTLGDLSTLSAAYRVMEQDDVPRTDRIASGRNLIFDFSPQRLQQSTLRFQTMNPSKWLDFLQITGQWNKQDEGRLEVRTSAPSVERRLSDTQTMLELNVELGTFIGDNHRLLYGVDLGTESIASSRTDVDVVAGTSSDKRGRYTDGATYQSLGIYLQDRIKLGNVAHLTVGGRFNRNHVGGEETSSVGTLSLDGVTTDFTGLANLVIHVTPNLNLIGNVGRGFRAPNIDDVSIYDERSNGTEVPNPNLSPERIVTFESGFKLRVPQFRASAFAYMKKLDDLLIRAPGTINGLSYFDTNNDGVQDANEPDVLLRQNLGMATIKGIELQAEALPHPQVALFGNFTYTHGDDETAGVPLRRIPPAFGMVGARWSSSTSSVRPWVEAVSHFAAAQTRLNPGDESDFRIGPEGTPGYAAFEVRGGVTVSQSLRVHAALENLTNKAYRYHGSGVFRPGRQVRVAVEYGLGR